MCQRNGPKKRLRDKQVKRHFYILMETYKLIRAIKTEENLDNKSDKISTYRQRKNKIYKMEISTPGKMDRKEKIFKINKSRQDEIDNPK